MERDPCKVLRQQAFNSPRAHRRRAHFRSRDVTRQLYDTLSQHYSCRCSVTSSSARVRLTLSTDWEGGDALYPFVLLPEDGPIPEREFVNDTEFTRVRNPTPTGISSHVTHANDIPQALNGPEQPPPDDVENISLEHYSNQATPTLACVGDIENQSLGAFSHWRSGTRVTMCHALIATSVVGIATSLSLSLWWSFAHGDPGSGFTMGSYVLAVFGVLVAIPGDRHSKVCRCWDTEVSGG